MKSILEPMTVLSQKSDSFTVFLWISRSTGWVMIVHEAKSVCQEGKWHDLMYTYLWMWSLKGCNSWGKHLYVTGRCYHSICIENALQHCLGDRSWILNQTFRMAVDVTQMKANGLNKSFKPKHNQKKSQPFPGSSFLENDVHSSISGSRFNLVT